MQLRRPRPHALRRDAERRGDLGDLSVAMRQKFMQRRVKQPDGHRQPLHDLEQRLEIAALHRQQFGQRRAAARLILGEDHLAHRDNPLAVEEHMLGAAEADALGAELHRLAGIQRRFGIGAHFHAPVPVSPDHQRRKFAGKLRQAHLHLAFEHLALRPVNGDHRASLKHPLADGHRLRLVVDADRPGAGDAGLAHAARHHRRVARHAAARGQNAFRRVHAVDILRAGLHPDQNDLAPGLLRQLGGCGREHDFPRCRAGRGRQPAGDQLALGLRINRRMQQLIQRQRINPHHRIGLADDAFRRQINRDFQRGPGGALAAARLQHPEFAALDSELHILHVAVMRFEQRVDARQLGVSRRHGQFHRGLGGAGGEARRLGDVLRRADARHHILALRIDQKLAVERLLAG